MGSKLVALVFQEEVHTLSTWAAVPPAREAGASEVVMDDSPDQAMANLKTIQEKANEAGVKLEDAVVVYRAKDGRVKIKQTKDMTAGKGAGRGAFWGLLVGLLLGGPVGGLLGGLGVGALYGKFVDHGIDDKFIRDVGNSLKPTKSAVLLLIPEENYPGAIAYLKTFDTEIYEAEIGEDVEEAVREAAEKPEVAQAVEDEFSTE